MNKFRANLVTFILLISLTAVYSIEPSANRISSILPFKLRCEYLDLPLSLETPNPRLSWILTSSVAESKNQSQTAYRILVSSSKDELAKEVGDLWDSGVVKSHESVNIKYAGKAFESGQMVYWSVKVWDQLGHESAYSSPHSFGIGLLQPNDWKAKWIGAPDGLQKDVIKTLDHPEQELMGKLTGLVPSIYMRKTFTIKDDIKVARLFASAKGIYKLFINGKEAHYSHFDPGWTDYNKTMRYQSFDVRSHFRSGENVIGVVVAPGWYSGYVGFNHRANYYGNNIRALVQMEINGETVVSSDSSWKVSTGPIVYSDFLMGETYYMDREMKNWSVSGFDDSKWNQVVVEERDAHVQLIGDVSEPIKTIQTIFAKRIFEVSPGVFIFDFGQNFAGWCGVKVKKGQKAGRIQLRHAEVLTGNSDNGTLYVDNLRAARAIDTIVIKQQVNNSFFHQPSFTYHGFRFVEVTGFSGKPNINDVYGFVVHSSVTIRSTMVTSNTLVNQLIHNIQWGLRSNFMSVPTDCPQRDERMGWTGDAQTFASTAVYNGDLAAFYTKWIKDMVDAQSSVGGFPDVAPRVFGTDGSPGWVDAGVIIPWVVYNTYNDIDIINTTYPAMTKLINYIKSVNPDFVWRNRLSNNGGDWLEMNASTNKIVLSTAFYARDVLIMSKIASVLGKTNHVQMYSQLFQNIKAAFNKNFVKDDGSVTGDTQSAYLFALAYELLPEKIRPLTAAKLVANIKQHNMHLTTGFFGVALLNPVLTEFGYNDIAYQLLLQDTMPSWLYPIKSGKATTIWERWDGWTKDKGFQTPAMNSFNHYSLGSVGRWLYEHVAGISSDGVGYKNIIIRPNPDKTINSVTASYDSIHGLITSSWENKGDITTYTIFIPVNTLATVYLPGQKESIKVGSGISVWKIKNNK